MAAPSHTGRRAPLPGELPAQRGVTVGTLLAELFGVWFYVWMGTGTVLATQKLHPGPLDDTAISIAFALAVLVAVYVTGNISGAHLNPAVTIGLAAVGKFPWRVVPGYLIAQFAGAILAALTNWLFFGEQAREKLLLGATHPGIVGAPLVVLGEFLLTLVLMVTIMATAVDDRSPGPWSTGLAIGLVVGAGIYVMLPVTGGSFNPARTLGPMIVSAQFPGWWAYIVGPVAGAVAGAWLWQAVLRHGVTPGAGRQPD